MTRKMVKGVVYFCDEKTGRWYRDELSKKVNGDTTTKRTWGELIDCDHCGRKMFQKARTKTTLCSPACKAKARAKVQRAKRQASPSKKKAEADRLFSLIVRSVGECESMRTEHQGAHQCAHGISRRYLATRWGVDVELLSSADGVSVFGHVRNAWCFCAGCHTYFTHRPLEWRAWLRTVWGPQLLEEIEDEAQYGPNPDIDEVLARLRAEWREIQGEAA